MLPTPSASTYGSNRGGAAGRTGKDRPSLDTMARKGLWPTPAARDGTQHGYTPACTTRRQKEGHSVQLPERLSLEERGPLNPAWVEWLMGFPIGWTDLEPSETP